MCGLRDKKSIFVDMNKRHIAFLCNKTRVYKRAARRRLFSCLFALICDCGEVVAVKCYHGIGFSRCSTGHRQTVICVGKGAGIKGRGILSGFYLYLMDLSEQMGGYACNGYL